MTESAKHLAVHVKQQAGFPADVSDLIFVGNAYDVTVRQKTDIDH